MKWIYTPHRNRLSFLVAQKELLLKDEEDLKKVIEQEEVELISLEESASKGFVLLNPK